MNFKNNRPFIKSGLEISQISFSGGRIAANIAAHGGITNINYYGNQRFGDVALYKADPISAWAHLFRTGVCIDKKTYILEFNDTLIYPFGYSSFCSFVGVEFNHGLYLLNDALVFTLKINANPEKKKVSYQMINTTTCTQVTQPTRTWEETTLHHNINTAVSAIVDKYSQKIIDEEKERQKHTLAQAGSYYNPPVAESKIWVGVTANSNIEFKQNPSMEGLHKHYFSSDCQNGENYFCLVFSHEEKEKF